MAPSGSSRPTAGPGSGSGSYSTRMTRGLSEHNSLLADSASPSPVPVTRIGSVPSLAAEPRHPLLHPEETDDFHDALSTHHGAGRSARTLPSAAAAAHGASMALAQSARSGVPNGYHFTLGVSSAAGSGARGTGGYQETEKEDWC